MKSGKSLTELAQQLEDIKKNSRDFIVPTERLAVVVDESEKLTETEKGVEMKKTAEPVVAFTNGEEERLRMNSWSDRQLSSYADIPHGYYERLKTENPYLFADNVNHGLRRQAASDRLETRMLRTYRGGLRALLSSRYRRLDCWDLMNTIFPVMVENQFEVQSSELTERKLYIQAVTPRVQTEVVKGDVVQFGLTISSSDVGAGSVRVEPLIYRLVCLNGMITSAAIRKFHIGKSQAEDEVYELLTDETRELTDGAFWAQVRDVVMGSMRPEIFEREVDKLRIAANDKISNFDLPRVVELTAKTIGISGEGTKQSIVEYLASGADGAGLTRWGLANAVTHAAHLESVGYDESVDIERAGAKVIDLTPKQWSVIASKPE